MTIWALDLVKGGDHLSEGPSMSVGACLRVCARARMCVRACVCVVCSQIAVGGGTGVIFSAFWSLLF